ncbi:Exosome complex component Rrp41 [uncultured archaeon]|nr:Exosome complex component Rrp41 [uncultured archaeon]
MKITKDQLLVNGKRNDGRSPDDLRSFKVTAGVLKKAKGSAMVEWGKNKVLVGIYGPGEVFPKHLTNYTKALVNVRYSMAPFCGAEEHGRSGPNRRAIEIGKVAKHVFENIILTRDFPRTQIDIYIEILQSDGGTRVAGITAASVALADAGIPCKDLVQGVSAGKVNDTVLVDLDKWEDNLGEGDCPVVVSLRSNEILLFQLDEVWTKQQVLQGFEKIFNAAKVLRQVQEESLKENYKEG